MDSFPNIKAPAYGLEDAPEADVEEVKMGDGYTLRRPKGINYIKDKWDLTWDSLEDTDARSTFAWLKARMNLIPFLWTHPVSGVVYQVICKSPKLTYNQFNDEVLTATFEQDFNPAS
jgi:phage-related protein